MNKEDIKHMSVSDCSVVPRLGFACSPWPDPNELDASDSEADLLEEGDLDKEQSDMLNLLFKLAHRYKIVSCIDTGITNTFLVEQVGVPRVLSIRSYLHTTSVGILEQDEETKKEEEFILQRTPREVRIMTALQHAFFMPLLLAWHNFPLYGEHGFYAYITPLYEQMHLPDIWDNPVWVKQYARKLLEAIEQIHAAGFIHRDLKPEHCFFMPTETDEPPQFIIIDWDLSAYNKDLTHYRVAGSKYYMAPEMNKNKGYNHKIDLYSAGVILGQLAYKQVEIPTKQQLHEWRSQKVEDPLKIIVKLLLEPEPTKRPEAEQILRAPYFL